MSESPLNSGIGSNLIVKDEDGEWIDRGRRSFIVLPRVGEHISIMGGDRGLVIEVVQVVHPGVPTEFVDIYAVEVGSMNDCLERIKPRSDPGSLTKTERLLLWNQYYALSKLYPDEAKFFAERCEILEQGYTLFYDTEHIDPHEVGEDECREVIQIMNMFRMLVTSYEELPDKSGIDRHDVNFEGFSGNDETSLMVFVRFLVHTQGKFEELKAGTRDDFNSHMPRLDCYRRMRDHWERSPRKYELSRADIISIVAARNRFA